MQAIRNIVQLRELLAKRFPGLRTLAEIARAPGEKAISVHSTGLGQLDRVLQGGLPKSAITELVCPPGRSGSALLIARLLRHAWESRQWSTLIDGQDSFDPASLENKVLSRLLWVRCENAAQALKAADLLLRDGNLPLLLLDLRLNPSAQLRKVPATTWYRFQRIVENNPGSLLVITPHALVSNAQARVVLSSRFTLKQLSERENVLLSNLKFELVHRRQAAIEPEPAVAEAG